MNRFFYLKRRERKKIRKKIRGYLSPFLILPRTSALTI